MSDDLRLGLQVARCTKIIQGGKDETGKDELKYLINCKQHGKYVVDLGEKVSPTDIEEGMRIGYVLALADLHSQRRAGADTLPFLHSVWTERSSRFRSPCPPRSTPP